MMKTAKSPDTTAMVFALFAATTMIAQQVAGKATRDALFLSNFDVTNLPKIVIAAAIASMAGVLVMSRLLTRYSPALLVPVIFGISALFFLGEWVLLGYQPGIVSIILYLHMAVFGAILISGFWSIINERFDPHSAKQRVARIAAAAAFGGVIGGVLTERVAALLDVRTMLLVLGGLHAICLVAVRCIGAPKRAIPPRQDVKTRSAFALIGSNRYLQWMAALMVLVAVMAALVDYAFKAEASARYRDSESLAAFFATFYAAVGLLGFVLQTLLGRRVLQQFGIGATIAILPAIIAMVGSIGAALTQLWSMVLLRGSHAVFVNSFFRSAFELLYTPLAPYKKRPTKSIIDVASDRLGDMIGSGMILLLLFLLPGLPTALIVATAVMVALLALYVVNRLNSGYISQLAHNLRKGVVRIEEDDIIDATTRKILAEYDNWSEREFLQSRIDSMLEHPMETAAANARGMEDKTDLYARALSDLASGDAERIRGALSSSVMDIHLTPRIIPLLENDEVVHDVRTELRWQAPRIIGQLTDALLDPDVPLLARQRLPGVLEASHNPRAIDGLLLGIRDESFNVRFSSARALGRMRSRNPGLVIPREQVFSAIRRELDVSAETWEGHDLELQPEEAAEDIPLGLHINRGLQHVFTLLTLTLDPGAVNISRQAIFSTDSNLRGTALEYLENVLPADLYNKLLDHLGASDEGRKGLRSLSEIVTELKSVVHHRIPK
jgi:MFS family permease